MLESADLIAFAPTTDLARARAFYEGILGLRLVTDNGFALVFDARGTMLRVTQVPEPTSARYTVLGWAVSDIATTVEGLAERGVAFERYEGFAQDESGIWKAPGGDLVAWFKDPDANTLSVTQFDRSG